VEQLGSPRRDALRAMLVAQVSAAPAARPSRRPVVLAAAACGLVLAGTGAALFGALHQSAAGPAVATTAVHCAHGTVTTPSQVAELVSTVVRVPTADGNVVGRAIDDCARLWRAGSLGDLASSGGSAGAAPHLVACRTPTGTLNVFAGSSTLCRKLGEQRA